MTGKGVLFFVGEDSGMGWGSLIQDYPDGKYDRVIMHQHIAEAIEELSVMDKGQLGSIQTFLLDDRIAFGFGERAEKLLGKNPPPDGEMSTIFMATAIKQIYREKGLTPPPVLMGTPDVVRERGNTPPVKVDAIVRYADSNPSLAGDVRGISDRVLKGQNKQ